MPRSRNPRVAARDSRSVLNRSYGRVSATAAPLIAATFSHRCLQLASLRDTWRYCSEQQVARDDAFVSNASLILELAAAGAHRPARGLVYSCFAVWFLLTFFCVAAFKTQLSPTRARKQRCS